MYKISIYLLFLIIFLVNLPTSFNNITAQPKTESTVDSTKSAETTSTSEKPDDKSKNEQKDKLKNDPKEEPKDKPEEQNIPNQEPKILTKKSSWYLGFGYGSGNGSYKLNGKNYSFTEPKEDLKQESRVMYLNLGFGRIMQPNFHLGGEINLMASVVQYTSEKTSLSLDHNINVNSFMLVATYFPTYYYGLEGFLIKGGLGLTTMIIESQLDILAFDSIAIRADEKIDSQGYIALFGLGYTYNLGKTFNLGINTEYSYQYYKKEEEKPSNSWYWVLFLSFYWF